MVSSGNDLWDEMAAVAVDLVNLPHDQREDATQEVFLYLLLRPGLSQNRGPLFFAAKWAVAAFVRQQMAHLHKCDYGHSADEARDAAEAPDDTIGALATTQAEETLFLALAELRGISPTQYKAVRAYYLDGDWRRERGLGGYERRLTPIHRAQVGKVVSHQADHVARRRGLQALRAILHRMGVDSSDQLL